MRRHLQVLTFMAAIAAPSGIAQAQTLTAAKIDSVNKAADSFVALAKDSHTTGKPPRYSDAAAKPLLDTVFNTKDIEGGKPLPWSSIQSLSEWNRAVVKVGLIYYLAGTGTTDLKLVGKDPKVILKATRNMVAFAPEMGRYSDAQVRIHFAMVEAGAAQAAASTPEERKDATFKATLNSISDGTAATITGLLGNFVIEGLPDEWLLSRVVILLDITTKTAKFLAPEDRHQVRNAAATAADHVKNPDVKSALNIIARAFGTY